MNKFREFKEEITGLVVPMPVPAGATSLEKSSRAFFCLWWTANQITASRESWKKTRNVNLMINGDSLRGESGERSQNKRHETGFTATLHLLVVKEM